MSSEPGATTVVTIDDNAEVLEIMRDEHMTPLHSAEYINQPTNAEHTICTNCLKTKSISNEENDTDNENNQDEVKKVLQEREKILNAEFQKRLDREVASLKDRFDFILQNEQIRASYMLTEAHRERQEKIQALQTQLECKNLAGLMYVMCSERRKSKLEKMRIIEEYSGYIKALQDILTEGQNLILNLSRGYKTAARVDHEWRRKMKKVMAEFQLFVTNFTGGTPEANQFFFDLPTLMKTETPVVDNPSEDPCEEDELIEEEQSEISEEEKTWWSKLDEADRPFVMFGDMADFKPPQRREVLKHIKAAKTAPKKWKEYVFNDMFVSSECCNMNSIKDDYSKYLPMDKWECHGGSPTVKSPDNKQHMSRVSLTSRRATTTSIDVRGNMGSLLKIITSAGLKEPVTKATLLGARDSMEIASTTKLRDKDKPKHLDSKVTINVGNRRTSIFEQIYDEDICEPEHVTEPGTVHSKVDGEEEAEESVSDLGSIPNDSLEVIQAHVPDQDHKIHYEKVCPMDKCKRMQMSSFVRSLPPYMRASPFTHFEQTFDEYEACSPEQLAILKQRLEDKKKKERGETDPPEVSPLVEWSGIEGVSVQTSDIMMLPPCTCDLQGQDDESHQRIFNLADLIPVKQTLNKINKELFFDRNVAFDRFKVVGQDPDDESKQHKCKGSELQKIKEILTQNPSLLELFQANTQC